jgi:pyrimidine deaminase RibD-like protein/ubiquinone/menaquinone biosynthesis C-methylase UbiE
MRPEQIEEHMRLAISRARHSTPEERGKITPYVGAVIANEYGDVIATAYRNEDGRGGHAEFLVIEKARRLGHTNFGDCTIYATLEPCTHRRQGKTPCSQRIVESGFFCVYIGALDPNPAIRGHGEFYLRERIENVERFPGDLEREIRSINRAFWDIFVPSHLPSTSMYVQRRIPDMLRVFLKEHKIDIPSLSLDSGSSLRDLENIILNSNKVQYRSKKLHSLLRQGVATAFDLKYSDYSYEFDARKVGQRWKREIPAIILKRFNIRDYTHRNIINVGFGNGEEGIDLFSDCTNFTAVDIAPESLRSAQLMFPKHTFICCSADEMPSIGSGSQDLYISLRAYQSAFFDIDGAVEEAYRVLKPGGGLIISIANAYLEGAAFVRGLLPHGSSIIDTNEAHRRIGEVRRQLLAYQFIEIGVHSGFAEEYVFAVKPVY